MKNLARCIILMVVMMSFFGGIVFASDIYDAIKDGDTEKVKRIIEEDPGVINKKDSNNFTALHLASERGHNEIVTLLLEKGAKINEMGGKTTKDDKSHLTPLDCAVKNNHFEVIKLLLNRGADVNIDTGDGFTPFMTAAYNSDPEILEIMLAKGADMKRSNKNGHTALTFAILGNKPSNIKFLIDKGADINAVNKDKATLLHAAAGNTNVEILEMLTDKGLDINAKDKSGTTPLIRALFKDKFENAEFLVNKGADVNMKVGDLDFNALQFIAQKEKAEVPESLVTLLIKKGVDVNYLSKGKFTPLYIAVVFDKVSLARILIENGADVNKKCGSDGKSPIHAVESIEMLKLLLDNRANPNQESDIKELPIHNTIKKKVEIIAEFIKIGNNVNAKDRFGLTPLHRAAYLGLTETVKFLIENGADVNLKCKGGETAADFARKEKHKDVVELLEKAGGK